ncbi:DNA-directed primase/polymerase protein-like [Pomacea canaliculata]|uniref:DNA-directed primase/polymerase protein-like n=1 Tax=Pomacea canaliculata TaxID=400727 RepID=UPI000D72F0FD|nr:DNA-directed primase/polymerase protein-like [Pomacea canaliculata]
MISVAFYFLVESVFIPIMAEINECSLPPVKFYGVKTKKHALAITKALQTQVKKMKKEKIPNSFHPSILGPSIQWKIFSRQQDAFSFSHGQSEDLHVFAFESKELQKHTGQRKYLVTSYPVFWHYYMQLDPLQRYHYEVIPEGAVCKLYFDLEFQRDLNTRADGEAMVDTFIRYVCVWLREMFQIQCDKSDILDLDASTESKFSRHLIFQTDNAVFSDNISAGNFVREIFWKLEDHLFSQDNSPQASEFNGVWAVSQLEIQKEQVPVSDGDEEQITHGPSFKEFVKTDFQGSISFLSIPPDSKCCSNQSNGSFHNQVHYFQDNKMSPHQLSTGQEKPSMGGKVEGTTCLCSNTSDDRRGTEVDNVKGNERGSGCLSLFKQFTAEELQQLFVKNKHGKNIFFADLGVYTKNRNFRLYKSCKLGKNNPFEVSSGNIFFPKEKDDQSKDYAIFLSSLIANVRYDDQVRVISFEGERSKRKPSRKLNETQIHAETLEGYSTSPYPEVDQFIFDLVSMDDRKGVIRRWMYFPTHETLNFDIIGYRFCYNIQRQHKSNNIRLVVDLKRGVWYQKCYDPDCQAVNFKSHEFPVPESILPAYFFRDDFDEMEEEDDHLCLEALLEAENTLLQSAY